jgi:hypothetical protein
MKTYLYSPLTSLFIVDVHKGTYVGIFAECGTYVNRSLFASKNLYIVQVIFCMDNKYSVFILRLSYDVYIVMTSLGNLLL